MKKIIYSLLVAAGLASCSDSLEQTPIGVLAQGNLPASDEDAIALVNAAYQVNVNKSTAFGYMTDLVTETTISGENPNGGGGLLGLLKWDGNNSYITGMWRDLNHGIAAANDAIDNVRDNERISLPTQTRVIGEARFLRAYYLNYAVQFWGDFPIVLHNIEGSGVSRQPIDKVYEQIVADLRDAAEKLPVVSSYSSADKGRATQGAAYALLSKVLLTWGQVSPTLDDTGRKEKYAQAVEAANLVTGYELEENFLANWDNGNRNGKESIFATQHDTGSALPMGLVATIFATAPSPAGFQMNCPMWFPPIATWSILTRLAINAAKALLPTRSTIRRPGLTIISNSLAFVNT